MFEVMESKEQIVLEAIQPKLVVLDRKNELRTHKKYWILRRSQDVFFSLIALIVLSPVFLLTAVFVFIDDPHGSPIAIQQISKTHHTS